MNSKVDFSGFGAKSVFPGDLRMSWGACLVEPPAIGALRTRAKDKLVRLGDLAPPRSGIPTRVVGYFCVEEIEDPDVIRRLGLRSNQDRTRNMVVKDGRGAIHILERGALKPMVRQPKYLEGRIKVDASMTAPWHMLYLTDDRIGLEAKRWDRTLAYIRYGETQDFPAGENSRRAGGVPAERPQVKVRPVWFQVPRIPTGDGRVCWLKGRGDTHYVPTLAENILVPDNFLYSVPPAGMKNDRAFAAVANLSWTHLMAEVNGRRGAGDGVLHTYIRELHKLPLIDPRQLTKNESDELVGLFDQLAERAVYPIAVELMQKDRQAFDRWAMKYLFGDDAEDAVRAVELALRDLVRERTQRAVSGREQVSKATRRTVFDPAPIAARLLVDHGAPPQILQMFKEIENSFLLPMQIDIPRHEPGIPELGETLLDQGCVVVNGHSLLEAPSDQHASAIVAHLTVNSGYSGPLDLPSDLKLVDTVTKQWERDVVEWISKVRAAAKDILPRPQQATRRIQALRELEQQAHVAPGLLAGSLDE
jgi:hypothetical protein